MKCSVRTCAKSVTRRQWCEAHYRRFLKYGDPTAGGTPKGAARQFLEDTKIYEGDDCVRWPFGTLPRGYGLIGVDGKMKPVHRIICEYVNGPQPTPLHEAAHSCGNGHLGCITPRHLSWKTHQENEKDKVTHGTIRRGETVPSAKLTATQVIKIRTVLGTMSQQRIAHRFGVAQTTISLIKRGRIWTHI